MVHIVGAGCGAIDLITLRGKRLIENADVIIYAGSLVNPELLSYAKAGCAVYDSAKMTLEEIVSTVQAAEEKGLTTVRLHTGDPALYGAIGEQMRAFDRLGIAYDITPGPRRRLAVRAGGGGASSKPLAPAIAVGGISFTLAARRVPWPPRSPSPGRTARTASPPQGARPPPHKSRGLTLP